MTPNRRTLLCAGVGLTAAIATPARGGPKPEGCERPPVDGAFDCGEEARAAAARDFGGLVSKAPRAVLRPASTADIAGAVQWARQRGLTVAARGQGHSTYGRAMTDGVVIDMSALDAVHAVAADRVTVAAGATWSKVLAATLAQGLTPPVLTACLGLSVGGTIAVGGIGGSSSRHGMQSDHVLALEVVTGEGRAMTCSADENPDLFDAVRAGLGQCGIVTRAVLRLARAPERVRRYQLAYRDLQSLAADQRRVLAEDRFDQVQGAVLPAAGRGWRHQLEAAAFHHGAAPDDGAMLAGLSDDRKALVTTDLGFDEDARAFAKLEQRLRQNGHWFNPQPWLFTFLRGSNAEQVASEVLDELTDPDLGPFGRVTFYPMTTAAFRTPLVRLPDESIAFAFNLVRIPATNDAATIARMVAQNQAIYERVRDAGGVQYPVSALPFSADGWTQHFGSEWPRLRAAKQRHDPDRVLTPGYEVF